MSPDGAPGRAGDRPTVLFLPPSCYGAGYFRRLHRLLAGRLDCRAVELPGHGRRYAEAPLTGAADAVRDLVEQALAHRVDAVCGESLGAYLGLAVAPFLRWARRPMLFAVANSPPLVREDIPVHRIGTVREAGAVLRDVGGALPPELCSDPELARSAYPLIHADLCLSQSVLGMVRERTFDGDIRVVAGADDPASTWLSGWAAHARGDCSVTVLPGGHLVSTDNPTGVADTLLSALPSP